MYLVWHRLKAGGPSTSTNIVLLFHRLYRE